MKQVIVSRNDKEEVWVATPTGNLLAECFFKAPDETPEELEHMGYPQLLHLYPLEEILVGPGIASEDVEEIFVEREPGRSTGGTPRQPLSCPGLRVRPPSIVTQNERPPACGERREADTPGRVSSGASTRQHRRTTHAHAAAP